jgi:hypothetical protein
VLGQITSSLGTGLTQKQQGYLINLRYQAVPSLTLQSDPTVIKLFTITRSVVNGCTTHTGINPACTRPTC